MVEIFEFPTFLKYALEGGKKRNSRQAGALVACNILRLWLNYVRYGMYIRTCNDIKVTVESE